MISFFNYKELVYKNGFQEYPLYNNGISIVSIFTEYREADLDLKIYLNKLILCRSFYGTYTAWYDDVKWFISNFFSEFKRDIIRPDSTDRIRYAVKMILADDPFIQGVIATTFLFPILEFYAKHKLGFQPLEYNYFDDKKTTEYLKNLNIPNKKRDLSIKSAFEQLKQKEFLISFCLNEIDEFTKARLTAAGIPSKNWTVHSIAERLQLARNGMLHGEINSFYTMGEYLLLLYSLFHLCDQKELGIKLTL